MLLINCKIELKLKWRNYCVLSAAGTDNTNDLNNVPVVALSAKEAKDN